MSDLATNINLDEDGNVTISVGRVSKTFSASDWLRMALRKGVRAHQFTPNNGCAIETRLHAGEQYENGWDVIDIAEYHGVSRRTIHRWMRQQGLRRDGPRGRAKDSAKAEAVRLVKQGLTIKQAASKVGAHYSTVSQWMQGAA